MRRLIFPFPLICFLLSSCTGERGENAVISRIDSLVALPDIDQPPAAQQVPEKYIDSVEENGLRMIVEIKNDSVFFTYRNTGEKILPVWSHTRGYGLTWSYIQLYLPNSRIAQVEFDGLLREEPGLPVSVSLKLGKNLQSKKTSRSLSGVALLKKELIRLPMEIMLWMRFTIQAKVPWTA